MEGGGGGGGDDGRGGKGKRREKKSLQYAMRSGLAGGLAGMTARTAVAPFDRVKILFQGGHEAFVPYSKSVFGVFPAILHIGRTDGIVGLYRGHAAMLLRVFPYAGINFMSYEQYKRVLIPDENAAFPLARLVCGSLSGTTATMATYPLDVIRTRLAYQVTTRKHTGIWHSLTQTLKHEGVAGLFKGLGPSIMGVVPYSGVSFYTFDTCKLFLLKHFRSQVADEKGHLYIPYKMVCGGTSAVIAQTVSYPLDVIRRRMQLQGFSSEGPQYAYRHTWHALTSSIRTSGFRSLFVGLSINYIKHPPAMAISFTTYEFMKEKLGIE